MSSLDFSAARLAHMTWKMKLRLFLDGKKEMSETQLVSHHDCDLGKWLYSKGMERYGNIPNMQKLEKIHVELHDNTRRIVELKKSADVPMAEKEYLRLERISDEIISLLTTIEQELK